MGSVRESVPKDYSGWMGNGSILPMQNHMICTPSVIYLSRKGRLGITYNVHRHMNCDAWNLRADDSSDSLSCCLPMRMNEHLDVWPQLQLQTHTLESDFLVCQKKKKKVFKHTSLPSPSSQHALGHHRVLSTWTIGLNIVKMSRMSAVGQREGGLSSGSDTASKSKLKSNSIFHHFCRWQLVLSFMHMKGNQWPKGKGWKKTHTFENLLRTECRPWVIFFLFFSSSSSSSF